MSFEEAREDYLEAIDNLNSLVDGYNQMRQEHPTLTHRHRVQTVPKETWGAHVKKRYAPRKMQSLREGPIETIKNQTKSSDVGLQMVVNNKEPSLLDRLLGRTPPTELNDKITTQLDEIHEAAKRVERVSRRVEELALQSDYHDTEEE